MTNHVFFSGAEFGSSECFAYLNSKADQSGNCGSGPDGYQPCQPKYVLRNLSQKLYLLPHI